MKDAPEWMALTGPQGHPMFCRKADVLAIGIANNPEKSTLLTVDRVGQLVCKESPAEVFRLMNEIDIQ